MEVDIISHNRRIKVRIQEDVEKRLQVKLVPVTAVENPCRRTGHTQTELSQNQTMVTAVRFGNTGRHRDQVGSRKQKIQAGFPASCDACGLNYVVAQIVTAS